MVEDINPEVRGEASEVTVAPAGYRRQPVGLHVPYGPPLIVLCLIWASSCGTGTLVLSCQWLLLLAGLVCWIEWLVAIRGSLVSWYT
ncbi:protein of unknown function [Methanoculleus bourgensis]|uniref:Uncharacterized protein n=1 Tax=Methanoculleus bourgensis TaxID=83986 RepID=A0A0X3BHK9_9EURY|nr:protein of unknown function [Methanoculleus bourgensis]